jgi:hypothetical protein
MNENLNQQLEQNDTQIVDIQKVDTQKVIEKKRVLGWPKGKKRGPRKKKENNQQINNLPITQKINNFFLVNIYGVIVDALNNTTKNDTQIRLVEANTAEEVLEKVNAYFKAQESEYLKYEILGVTINETIR